MGNSRRLIRAIDPQAVKKALASIARRKEMGPALAAFEASKESKRRAKRDTGADY